MFEINLYIGIPPFKAEFPSILDAKTASYCPNAIIQTIAGIILKTKDFKVFFEKINLPHQTNFEFEISREVFPLLDKMFNSKIIYRSIGIYLAGIEPEKKQQLQLFGDSIKRKKNEKLAKSLDKLEEKFGRDIVKPGFINDVRIKQDFLTK